MKRRRRLEERTIEVAEEVAAILARQGMEAAVIGAMALAVHRYIRTTRDFDLAVSTDPFSALRAAQREIQAAGFHAELRLPDAEDPLGGVLEITGADSRPVQVVNFHNPLAPTRKASELGGEAVERAQRGLIAGSPLRVVRLPHLVALKLYGGGPKSRSDVIELLERNQPLDLGPVRRVCARHGLSKELDSILAELRLR